MKTKRSFEKDRKVTKGTSSALLLSILIHVGLFLLAGALVVFTVVKEKEVEFEPPKSVERPKMKLKKPKVKVKKSSKPKTARITSKSTRVTMPDIQLPGMGGLGDGLDDGFGDGFELMPDLDIINVMGRSQTDGSDLVGTFYDFNRLRNGNMNGIDQFGYGEELRRFHKSGWNESVLRKFYRSPKKLYATTVAVPPMPSPLGPSAFDEPDNEDKCWMVLYKGKLVHKDGIKFRFVGNSDDKMAVRVDGKVVMDACREDGLHVGPQIAQDWIPDTPDHRKWYICHDYSAVSHLIELEPGIPKDIEIIIGEGPGSIFNAILFVKEEGVEYKTGSGGIPILPVFKTAQLPRRLQDLIYRGMPEDEVDVVGGPVFNDYSPVAPEQAGEPSDGGDSVQDQADEAIVSAEIIQRTWTLENGQTLEGKYVMRIGENVVLDVGGGRQKKVPLDRLSAEDLEYITIATPPRLKVELSKKTAQRILKHDKSGGIGIVGHVFSPKISFEKTAYDRQLTVDYWVIGSEINGNSFILLDKGSNSFVPSEYPDGLFRFSGNSVDLYKWSLGHIYSENRGERYKGYLVTVKDERGVMIAHAGSPTWLHKNLDNLKKLKVGCFLNDECNQVWPTPLDKPAH